MRVQKVNNHQSFGTKLIIDEHKYVQKEVNALPEQAKKGIDIAKRFLNDNGRDVEELKLFCADDMVGYHPRPNYWGLEIKPVYDKHFSGPKTYDLNIFKNKTAIQVAQVIVGGYKELVRIFNVR